jgi:DNA-binding transcriptional ArsR family regulator
MGEERESRPFEVDAPNRDDAGESFVAEDAFYRALAAGPRRRLLAYLLEHGTATRDDLASMLVGWETTETGGFSGPDDHQRTVIALEHVHLPLLDDAGLIDYDDETTEVTLDLDDPWAERLLWLGFEDTV